MSLSKGDTLKVLILSSEVAPYAKSGGLGDVAGSLPKELTAAGVDVRVAMPKYKTIKEQYFMDLQYVGSFDISLGWRRQKATILLKETEFPLYMIENDYYFGRDGYYGYGDDNERFAFFCKSALDMLPLIDFFPDVIQCNDWQTGPVCLILKENYRKLTMYQRIKTIFTIHNLQYQGDFSRDTMEMLEVPQYYFDNGDLEFYGQVSYMKAGLIFADMISTVSNTYSREIQTPRYGYGLDGVLRMRSHSLCGILNGIDYQANDPATDNRIVKSFDKNHIEFKKENKRALQEQLDLEIRDNVPMISIVSRLADQKGLDLIAQLSDFFMQENLQFVVLGTGETRYEQMFRHMAYHAPGKISANIMFDDQLAQRIYAASDMFLMPSLFEPCGLGQIFSLRYGTVPIVRKTGGLVDTIQHYDYHTKEGNGFVFEDYNSEGLLWALREALHAYWNCPDDWVQIIKNGMSCDYSWKHSAQEYIQLYRKISNKDMSF